MRLQRQPRDDTETPSTTAFESPEQIRIAACVDDAYFAVGSDDFGFQQAGGGSAKLPREAAEPTCLHQTGDADGEASTALNQAAARRRNGIVDLPPDRPCPHADRML